MRLPDCARLFESITREKAEIGEVSTSLNLRNHLKLRWNIHEIAVDTVSPLSSSFARAAWRVDPAPLAQLPQLESLKCELNSFSFEDCPTIEVLRERLGSSLNLTPQYGGLDVNCTTGRLAQFIPLEPLEKPIRRGENEITSDRSNDIWGFKQDGKHYAIMGTYAAVSLGSLSDQ